MEHEKLLYRDNRFDVCPECRGRLVYRGSGTYRCEVCGYEKKDDFGRVKEYLELHGPTPAFQIARETKIPVADIERMLKLGRLEIPEGSKGYIHCERCGCELRYGRFCPQCARELAGDIKQGFLADAGERPKEKMRFLDKERKGIK